MQNLRKRVTGCSKLFHRWLECIGYIVFSPVRWGLELMLQRLKVIFLYRVYSSGIGDTFAISAVLSAIHHVDGSRGIVFSKIPELFVGNPHVIWHIDYNKLPRLFRSLLKTLAKYSRGRRVICVGHEKWFLGTWPWRESKFNYEQRWLEAMVPDYPLGAHLGGAYTPPVVAFDPEEQKVLDQKFADLPKKFAVIKATAGAQKRGFTLLKNWSEGRMQAVVDATFNKIPWVQVGEAGEQLLNNVLDRRGLSLRESLYVISRANMVLCVEGFVSHAAAGLKVPAIVVFSGYHDPDLFVYKSTIKITAQPSVDCAPCYLSECKLSERKCVDNISVNVVVEAVLKQWGMDVKVA